jgi:hypothetical protein
MYTTSQTNNAIINNVYLSVKIAQSFGEAKLRLLDLFFFVLINL